MRDHCDLGIGAAEYTQWDHALKAYLERDPVQGMYPDDHLVIFFDNGTYWKGEGMQPARLRGLRDDLGRMCANLTKWKHVVYVESYPTASRSGATSMIFSGTALRVDITIIYGP